MRVGTRSPGRTGDVSTRVVMDRVGGEYVHEELVTLDAAVYCAIASL